MKIECILELMKEKKYIDKYDIAEYDCMPEVYRIKNNRGVEFGKKLLGAIANSKEYLIDVVTSDYSELEIAKKSDIDNWLQRFSDKEDTSILWSDMRLDPDIFHYIKGEGYEAKKTYNHIKITNLAIRKERMKKEEAKNQEAIDLLEQLL